MVLMLKIDDVRRDRLIRASSVVALTDRVNNDGLLCNVRVRSILSLVGSQP
jgi:hypothetical protein